VNHIIVLAIILPIFSGALLLLLSRRPRAVRRRVNLATTILLVAVSVILVRTAAGGEVVVYQIGNWPAPYGIVLVLDRLSALMVLLSAVIGLLSLVYAIRGADTAGRSFHALFQFQLAGLNGAFLTGDLFNLFVFFEVLLLGSYGLLLHGGSRIVCQGPECSSLFGGPDRTRSALHYVMLNLVGSSLFLIAVGLIYAATGTLNMADLAAQMNEAAGLNQSLVEAGALLLLVVFGLKAALVPLHFWLVPAYSNASAPVAALFALMTKVGVYAIIRIHTLVFGDAAGPLSNFLTPWLMPLALVTFATGVVGVMASRSLRRLISYLILVSVGTLVAGIGLSNIAGLSGALYYLVHTTLVTAGLFLLADLVATQRQAVQDRLQPGPAVSQVMPLATLFFIGAVAIAGLPPLSGLVGKLMILQASIGHQIAGLLWTTFLVGTFFVLVKLSRAGSMLFWKVDPGAEKAPAVGSLAFLAPAALLAASALLVIGGGTAVGYTEAAAEQVLSPQQYIGSVLGEGKW